MLLNQSSIPHPCIFFWCLTYKIRISNYVYSFTHIFVTFSNVTRFRSLCHVPAHHHYSVNRQCKGTARKIPSIVLFVTEETAGGNTVSYNVSGNTVLCLYTKRKDWKMTQGKDYIQRTKTMIIIDEKFNTYIQTKEKNRNQIHMAKDLLRQQGTVFRNG